MGVLGIPGRILSTVWVFAVVRTFGKRHFGHLAADGTDVEGDLHHLITGLLNALMLVAADVLMPLPVGLLCLHQVAWRARITQSKQIDFETQL